MAEKAEESLEAMRTGRIDAGDLKRLSPFSGRHGSHAHFTRPPMWKFKSSAGPRACRGSGSCLPVGGGADSWLRERDVSFLVRGPAESTSSDAPSSTEAETVKVQ